jgi:hypothetical protein
MGGKGATGAVPTNDAVVQMQQQQAAQATQANQERNARLAYGTQNIKNIFEGTPTGATPLDFSGITQASVPTSGMSPSQEPAVMQQWLAKNPSAANPFAPGNINVGAKASLPGGYSWGQLPDDGSGTPQYGLYDASGNLVNSGSTSDLAATKVYSGGNAAAGTQGGFQPDFYNKYTQSILNYYMPQEGQQYNTARSSLSYSLARAGQLNSSTAGMDVANLANQDAINRAQIASGADTQTAALRSTVQQDEQSALNQLYSTEDPSVAANTAQNMVANANLTKPLLNPAGALFAPITVGVGNALSGFTNPLAYINPSAGGVGSTMAATSTGAVGTGQNIAA